MSRETQLTSVYPTLEYETKNENILIGVTLSSIKERQLDYGVQTSLFVYSFTPGELHAFKKNYKCIINAL